MSTQFEVPGQRERPGSVTWAVYAQFAVGALAVLSTIVSVIQTNKVTGIMKEELAGADVEGLNAEQIDTALNFGTAISYVVIFGALLFGLGVALLGVFNLKGRNGARVTTWVFAGLGLLCSVCGSISGAANSVTGGATGGTGQSDAFTQAAERAAADVPGWYNTSSLVFAIVNLLLYLVIVVLLAVPASNDFFRKPKSEADIMLPPEAYQDAPPPPPNPSTDDGPSGPQPPRP